MNGLLCVIRITVHTHTPQSGSGASSVDYLMMTTRPWEIDWTSAPPSMKVIVSAKHAGRLTDRRAHVIWLCLCSRSAQEKTKETKIVQVLHTGDEDHKIIWCSRHQCLTGDIKTFHSSVCVCLNFEYTVKGNLFNTVDWVDWG